MLHIFLTFLFPSNLSVGLVHIPGLLIQTPKNCKMECEYLICLSFLQVSVGNSTGNY